MAANFNREQKLKAAVVWLRAALADEAPALAGGLIIRAAEQGIAERTLQRASKRLAVVKEPAYGPLGSGGKRGVEGWLWSLPAAVDASGAASSRSPGNARRKKARAATP